MEVQVLSRPLPADKPYVARYLYVDDRPLVLVDPSGMGAEVGPGVCFGVSCGDVFWEMLRHPVASWHAGRDQFCPSAPTRYWIRFGRVLKTYDIVRDFVRTVYRLTRGEPPTHFYIPNASGMADIWALGRVLTNRGSSVASKLLSGGTAVIAGIGTVMDLECPD